MSSDPPVQPPHHEFEIVHSDPVQGVGKQFGKVYPPAAQRLARTAVLTLLTWVPIVLLAFLNGHLTGRHIGVSLLRDP